MDQNILKSIANHQNGFSETCNVWLESAKVKSLIEKRTASEKNIFDLEADFSTQPLLSPKKIVYGAKLSLQQLEYSFHAARLRRNFKDITSDHIYRGENLLAETARYDTARAEKIQSISNQENPFTPFYAPYSDLVMNVDIAISSVDTTRGHASNAASAQVTQHFTKNSQTKLGQFAHTASGAVDTYSQMALTGSLENTKHYVSTVYNKAYQLQTSVRPENWQEISSTGMIISFTAKQFLTSGTLGTIAKFANFISVLEIESELNNLRYGLVLLRREAIKPIEAYNNFERQRQFAIEDAHNRSKNLFLNHSIGSKPSINGILYSTQKAALGSEDEDLKFNFKKAAIGFAIGFAFSTSSIALGVYLNSPKSDEANSKAEAPFIIKEPKAYA